MNICDESIEAHQDKTGCSLVEAHRQLTKAALLTQLDEATNDLDIKAVPRRVIERID